MKCLGIDIGGTGVKAAPVDVSTGRLLAERMRVPIPKPATPRAVLEAVQELVSHFKWTGRVGCTMPSVVKSGVVYSAMNIDSSWLGVDAARLFAHRKRPPVVVHNDADAAAVAEMQFGAGRGKNGLVLMVTLGTGIGTALFYRGSLVPNLELGQIEYDGKKAEQRATNRVREERDQSWQKWGGRVNEYLLMLEKIASPDLIIIGGGVSKHHREFFPYLKTDCKVVPAKLLNEAGIIGVALMAARPGDFR